MKCSFDFSLNIKKYSVIEQSIFRLVISGVRDAELIPNLLCVFSNEVIASSIKNLVNNQLLCVNVNLKSISPSNIVMALIDACSSTEINLDIPDEIINNDGLIEDKLCKQIILATLLPEINTGFLCQSIVFKIRGKEYE